MRRCLARSIQDLWCKVAICLATVSLAAGQSGEVLGRAYRQSPGPGTHDALLRFAEANAKAQRGALAYLALGAVEAEKGQSADALKHLDAAEAQLPSLRDYAAYFQGMAKRDLQQFGDVAGELAPVWKQPGAPLAARAMPILVQSELAAQRPQAARELVKRFAGQLGELQANLLGARAAEATGDKAAATAGFQKVYYFYPLSKDAKEAGDALGRLGGAATPEMVLARTNALMRNGQAQTARRELEQAVSGWPGTARDLGQVRIGVAQYFANENADAWNYLSTASVTDAEADGERQFYRHALARRLDRDGDADAVLAELQQRYPQSSWRLKALVAAGDRFLVRNLPDRYVPYYQACFESFPKDSQAAYCHWRITWNMYVSRNAAAEQWLKQHLERFPSSEKDAAALYFLGRLAQGRHEYGNARAYYKEIEQRFPNSYFAVTAQQQMRDNALRSAAIGAAAAQYLQTVQWPVSEKPFNLTIGAGAVTPMERARLLTSAGLDDLAELELRQAAEREPAQKAALAYELAKAATQQGAPERGVRYIKRYASNYLNYRLSDLPAGFWKFAFPMPYRDDLERNARANGLDPYMVAALIRQESEFDTRIISRAKAYGLMQVLPSTARDLGRGLGLGAVRADMLFDPAVNLKLGTAYLKKLLARWDNHWEETLASYNAGATRARSWVTWANFREPAEFAETIPFNETRGYVEIVLRNAELYRRLYGGAAASVPSTDGIQP